VILRAAAGLTHDVLWYVGLRCEGVALRLHKVAMADKVLFSAAVGDVQAQCRHV